MKKEVKRKTIYSQSKTKVIKCLGNRVLVSVNYLQKILSFQIELNFWDSRYCYRIRGFVDEQKINEPYLFPEFGNFNSQNEFKFIRNSFIAFRFIVYNEKRIKLQQNLLAVVILFNIFTTESLYIQFARFVDPSYIQIFLSGYYLPWCVFY